MEFANIQPIPVNGQEPTCLTALAVMAAMEKLEVSMEQVRLALKMSCIPPDSAAHDWVLVLPRALSLLAHPVRGYGHAL